jgi:hypothetical protein
VGINTTSPESELTVAQANAGGRGAELSLVNQASSSGQGVTGNEVAINFGTDPTSYNLDNGNAQIKVRNMNGGSGGNNASDMIFSTWNGSSFAERLRIQAGGNVGIGGITNPIYPLQMASGAYCNLAGQWVSVSDRNVKEDFQAIAPGEVLAKVAALPITQWKYKVEPAGSKHIGPMAQDFHAAFDLNGTDDRHISDIDEGGVALAAIQGLNQKLNEKDVEIQELKARLKELEATVKALAERK